MPDYAVAIVGAGVSGVYAAWRLCVDTNTVPIGDVVILEASDRVGGRLRSWPLDRIDPSLPSDPTVRAELGGMRILNYNIYAASLTNHLGLSLVSFPADVGSNWHYLRGDTLLGANYPTQTIYPVAPNEANWTPGDVVYYPLVENSTIVPKDIFPTADGKITQRDFVNTIMRTVEVDGVPAWKLGFWNSILLSGAAQTPVDNQVSYQAYAYFAEAGAYDTIPSNWNASVAFSNLLSDFSNMPSYWAISNGYQALPDAMIGQLQDVGPSVLRTSAQVQGVFYDQQAQEYVLTLPGGQVTAGTVILAMPPRAVEILALNPVAPSPDLTAPLASMLPQIRQSAPIPLFKVFLVYEADWWSESIQSDWPAFTRMTTDMPMRQIYNFGQTTDASGKTYHLFQAVYCDSLKAGYWAGLMPQEAENKGQDVNTDIFARIEDLGVSTIDTGTLQFGVDDDLSDFPLFAAAHAQFTTMIQQIAAGQTAPAPQPVAPVAGAAMNWGTDPYGGGVNFWNVGVELDDGNGGGAYWEMMNPAPNLHIIGEGYSLYQGWVEGALWSAEDMLQMTFQPGAPSWLNTVPYSGPAEHVPVTAAKRGLMARAPE